jgi:hypothetical protein
LRYLQLYAESTPIGVSQEQESRSVETAPDKRHPITICNGAPCGRLLFHKAGDGLTVLAQDVQKYLGLQILHRI